MICLLKKKNQENYSALIFYRTKCKIVTFCVRLVELVKRSGKTGNFFEKKGEYLDIFAEKKKNFDVNIVRFSCISYFAKQSFKARKRHLFSFRNVPIKSAKKFFVAERDVLKSAKKVPI